MVECFNYIGTYLVGRELLGDMDVSSFRHSFRVGLTLIGAFC